MRKLLLLLAIAALGLGVATYLRRRGQDSADAWSSSFETSSFDTAPAVPASDVSSETADAELPVDPDTPGAAPDAEAREVESDATDETRYDRLVEHEREERSEAAERLLEDPLTKKLEGEAERGS
ncbi:MAG: hypothetical protein M3322_09825 [Actinomycetota bacterium]|nr:hypothetical protein [Actinomycetota bacterium]